MKAFKLTTPEIQWIKANLHNYTTRQQFDFIMANRPQNKRACFSSFRTALYKLNLKKCKILRWADQETQFLLDNYATMGNIELAKNLSAKNRPFTKKNVEKKMRLMRLKRTPEMLTVIREKHKKKGVYSEGNYRRWAPKKAPEGERRVWVINGSPKVVIKINGRFIHYARYRYRELYGKIPPGHKVYHKDGNTLNVEDDNLVARPSGKFKRTLYDVPRKQNLKKIKRIHTTAPEDPPAPPVHKPKGVAVRIDRKTVVYVPAGTNIEELKRKMAENRKYSNF